MYANCLAGPYYFNDTIVSGVAKFQMLETYLQSEVEVLPQNAVFQQNGALPHLTTPSIPFQRSCFQVQGLRDMDNYVG